MVGELVAVLATEMLPESDPAVNGAKRTEKLVNWPAARFKGRDNPVTPNAVLEEVSFEMVTAAFPVFDSVTV